MGTCLIKPKDMGNSTPPKKGNDYTSDPPREAVSLNPTNAASHHGIQEAISKGKKIVRAMYDYTSTLDTSSSDYPDLNFVKGEVMEVITEDGDWWLAKNLKSNTIGYIPGTYVAQENSLDSNDWFHARISRKDTEKLIQSLPNKMGTFLIRESESAAGSYSLSVLDVNPMTKIRTCKHYRIRDCDDGGCYITTRHMCTSLADLVEYYTSTSDGLCCKLTSPCVKVTPEMNDLSREVRDHWEIDRSELILKEKLGSGNFGDVYRGLWKGKIQVAIKTLKKGTMEPSKFLEEATIMKALRHDKLVKLFAVCTKEEPLYIVTELVSNGSLLSYLKSSKGKVLAFAVLVDIAAQVASGMWYIEKEKYIHRDLAARNVLVGENNNIKIGDFGLARAIDEDIYSISEGAKFPIKWTAPEAALSGNFTIKSDVWAYGIILVEIVTYGQIPYPGMSNHEVLDQLPRGYRHPKPVGCSDAMYEVMLHCWKKEPDLRPTFEHLFHTMDDFPNTTQSGYVDTTQ